MKGRFGKADRCKRITEFSSQHNICEGFDDNETSGRGVDTVTEDSEVEREHESEESGDDHGPAGDRPKIAWHDGRRVIELDSFIQVRVHID